MDWLLRTSELSRVEGFLKLHRWGEESRCDMARDAKSKSGCSFGCLTVLILGVLIVVFSSGRRNATVNINKIKPASELPDTPVAQPAAKQLDDPAYTGHFMALRVIPAKLKAPASAKFCERRDCEAEEFTALRDSAGNTIRRWNVTGYVDSQNSFGAMIRGKWNVAFYLVGDRYVLGAAALDDEMFFCTDEYKKMVNSQTTTKKRR